MAIARRIVLIGLSVISIVTLAIPTAAEASSPADTTPTPTYLTDTSPQTYGQIFSGWGVEPPSNPVTAASGTITVPTVTCPGDVNRIESSWIGIDGVYMGTAADKKDNKIEQVGYVTDCGTKAEVKSDPTDYYNGIGPYNYVFYENYPAAQNILDIPGDACEGFESPEPCNPLQAGDKLSVSVTLTGNTYMNLGKKSEVVYTVSDNRISNMVGTADTYANYLAAGINAGAINEWADGGCDPKTGLYTAFLATGPVKFTNVNYTSGGTTTSFDQSPNLIVHDYIAQGGMINQNPVIETASNLTANGTFTTTDTGVVGNMRPGNTPSCT